MSKDTITFQLSPQKRAALDEIAGELARDRNAVLNEAIDLYLELHRWQVAHILSGIKQADAGEFASEAEVSAAFKRWRQ